MINLFRGELFKIKRSKITHVIAAIFIAIALFMLAMVLYSHFSTGKAHGAFARSTGWEGFSTAFDGDIFLMFIGMFVGTYICNEYSNGTIRQMTARGFSRTKIVLGQFLGTAFTMYLMFILVALFIFAVFSIQGSVGSAEVSRIVLTFFGYLAYVSGYCAFSVFIAHLVKNNAFSASIHVVVCVGGGLVSQLFSWLFQSEAFTKYWLTNMRHMTTDMSVKIQTQAKYSLIFMAIAVVFTALAVMIFRKRDID